MLTRSNKPTTGSRNRSALSSAPLGPRTFRELFLCANRTLDEKLFGSNINASSVR
ncbi:hypothetical protein RB7312 [Rhodopirellula baltica SH 1]|uniref:Uncharacterized protein n=1 Tax=Rhodopirellula baltica (strain DSM 10527 / NCIMB 13988 / SH1) TaxID=243090 RepID=Q7UNW1_RHOBA|nr:hypothetical protein RB7312 [Rhodopirellula baltica SH 1]